MPANGIADHNRFGESAGMTTDDRAERLYERATAILDGKANGFGEPILWHLALRRNPAAMIDLANRLSCSNQLSDLGRTGDAWSAAGMYHRAYRMGEHRAAQHLAVGCFNRRDLAGYRHWLRRAANAGDRDAFAELRRFELRLPHRAAGQVGRKRPYRRGE